MLLTIFFFVCAFYYGIHRTVINRYKGEVPYLA